MSSTDDTPARLLRIVDAFARESRLPLPAGGIDLDVRLEADLGLDSLGRSELLSRVEKGLDTSLPEEALLAATPRDLLALVGAGSGVQAPGDSVATHLAGSSAAGAPEGAVTLIDALHWHLERHPDRVHILFQRSDEQSEPISYQGLQNGAARVAGLLRRAGLQPGGPGGYHAAHRARLLL